MKIVSACLAGVCCRYDGEVRPCEAIVAMVRRGEAIPVCPEQLGGLPTPRVGAERCGSKVINMNGDDVTAQFERGAAEGLRIAQLVGCTEAILKAKSPSCGCGKVYDGSFSRTLIDGDGVFAALLKKNGIKIVTEETYLQ